VTTAAMLVGDIPGRGRDTFGHRTACKGDGWSRSYADLADRVARLAGGLAASGVCAGDRIAVLSPNDPGLVEVLFAASLVGAAVLPLNPRLIPNEVRYQVDDAEAKFAIVHPTLESLARAAGLLHRQAWLVGDELEEVVVQGLPYGGPRPSDESVLVHLYTSGTTGRPKGCLLTQRGWLSAIAGFAHTISLSPDDVVWVPLPLFHVAGIHYGLSTLAAGATLVFEDAGDAENLWRVVGEYGVTMTTLYPNPQQVIAHPDARRASASLRIVFCMPIGPSLHDALPGIPAATSYGGTELSGMALVAYGENWDRPGNVIGRPHIGLMAAVLDDDDRPVPSGEVGELCFRGPSVTIGTGSFPRPPPTLCTTDGSTRAISLAPMRSACCISSTARRTWSNPAAKTSTRSRSKPFFSPIPTSWTAP